MRHARSDASGDDKDLSIRICKGLVYETAQREANMMQGILRRFPSMRPFITHVPTTS